MFQVDDDGAHLIKRVVELACELALAGGGDGQIRGLASLLLDRFTTQQ